MIRGSGKVLLTLWLAGLGVAFCASAASAHVKWFSTFDVATAPQSLDYLQVPDFKILIVLALLVMALGCLLEESPLGPSVIRAFDRSTVWLRTDTDRLIRTVCAFFFIALWTLGGIILTPELKTDLTAISWLQLAIAIALVWRATSPLAALGIVFLFVFAVSQYGIFHLADYPIFLGIAAYIALTGMRRDLFGIRPIDLMRWAASITLMWASVEKWAYPQWSMPLLVQHPSLTLGYDSGLFMRAAGVIEFTLAFALLWTPLVRRAAATILLGMFIGACFEFGKLDVIGHAGIIIVLFVLVGDDATQEVKRSHLLFAPVTYAAALAAFLGIYYGMHAMLFTASYMDASPATQPAPIVETAAKGVERPLRFTFASRVTPREPSASFSDGFHTAR